MDTLLLEIVGTKSDIFIKNILHFSSREEFMACVPWKRKFSSWRTTKRFLEVLWGVLFCFYLFFLNMVGCAHRNIGANHLILLLVSDLGCICQWKDFDIC